MEPNHIVHSGGKLFWFVKDLEYFFVSIVSEEWMFVIGEKVSWIAIIKAWQLDKDTAT